MINKARKIVFDYVEANYKEVEFNVEDIYVVWFCKTLQNWKVLLGTPIDDDMYYEVTYNGDKKETYLDVYKKFDNIAIKD